MADIAGKIRRRKGVINLRFVDHTITAETTQPTVEGKPCLNCGSKVKFAYRKGTCVRCHKQWRRDHERRPKYYYSKANKNVLKIPLEKYYEILEGQNWSCAICGRVPKKNLFVDHCHETGKFRGLLCPQCNSGLGFFRDDPEIMLAAIEYLRPC